MPKISTEILFQDLKQIAPEFAPGQKIQALHEGLPDIDSQLSVGIDIELLNSEDLGAIAEEVRNTEAPTSINRHQSPIAWYLPYHLNRDWGIVISSSRLQEYAGQLWRRLIECGVLQDSDEHLGIALRLTQTSVIEHEIFHHKVENIVSRQELLANRILYKGDTALMFEKVEVQQAMLDSGCPGPIKYAKELEEALANAAGVNLSQLKRAAPELSEGELKTVVAVLHEMDSGLTGGYQHGSLFVGRRESVIALNVLAESYIRASFGSPSLGLRRDYLRPVGLPIEGIRKRIRFSADGSILGRTLGQLNKFAGQSAGVLTEEIIRQLITRVAEENRWSVQVDSELEFGKNFLYSVNKVRNKGKRSAIWRCVAKVLYNFPVARGHTVTGPKDRVLKNARGQSAWRLYVQEQTPQALRLHAWHGGTPNLVLLNVANHDRTIDFEL